MPWETTEENVRSAHRAVEDFQAGTLKTITLNEKEGIQAIVGKPQGKLTMETQSYMFSLDKGWTLQKAKEWVEKHNGVEYAGKYVFQELTWAKRSRIIQKHTKYHSITGQVINSDFIAIQAETIWASLKEQPPNQPLTLEKLLGEENGISIALGELLSKIVNNLCSLSRKKPLFYPSHQTPKTPPRHHRLPPLQRIRLDTNPTCQTPRKNNPPIHHHPKRDRPSNRGRKTKNRKRGKKT
jgi:hypothetical protein